jgi:hypothetical protein
VVSALVVASPNRFVAHDNGYAGTPSDCTVDLGAHKTLQNQFDTITGNGNVVQYGKIGSLGADTTFTVALGYGSDAATAIGAANGSLSVAFSDREAAYRSGWLRVHMNWAMRSACAESRAAIRPGTANSSAPAPRGVAQPILPARFRATVR